MTDTYRIEKVSEGINKYGRLEIVYRAIPVKQLTLTENSK